MTVATAHALTNLEDLKVWVSGAADPETLALLRDLGALPLTRADVLAEHPDDLRECLEACATALMTADVLVDAEAADPVDLVLARSAGVRCWSFLPTCD